MSHWGGYRHRPCAVKICGMQATTTFVDTTERADVSVRVCVGCLRALRRGRVPSHAGIRKGAPPPPRTTKYTPLSEGEVLQVLRSRGGHAAPRVIAEELCTSVHAVRRVTRRLEAKGLVTVNGQTSAKLVWIAAEVSG